MWFDDVHKVVNIFSLQITLLLQIPFCAIASKQEVASFGTVAEHICQIFKGHNITTFLYYLSIYYVVLH